MIFGYLYNEKKRGEKIQKGIMTCLVQSTTKVVCLCIVWSPGQPVPSTLGGFLNADRARGERAPVLHT